MIKNERRIVKENIMEYYVDLNSDIGESFGSYKIGLDEEIIKYVTSINLAFSPDYESPRLYHNGISRLSAMNCENLAVTLAVKVSHQF